MGIVVKQSIYNSIASYIGIVIGAINTIVLFPNIFSADEFGLTRVLGAAAGLICSFSMLGVQSMTLKFFPFFKEKENKHNGFLFFTLLVPLVGYIIFMGLAFLFKADIVDYYSTKSNLFGSYFNYIPLLVIYLIYLNVFDAYLRSLYKSVIYVFLQNVVLRLLWMIFILLYHFNYINFSQFIFYFVNVYALILIIEVLYTIIIKEFHVLPNFKKFNKEILIKIGLYSMFIILGASSAMISNTVDSLMIGALMDEGLSQVAFYSIALYMGTMILVPYNSIVRIVNSVISQAWKENDKDKIEKIYKQSSSNLMIIGTLLFLGMWLNADNIFEILPAEYGQAKYVLLYICIAKLYDACTGVNTSIIQFSDFFRLMLYFNGLLVLLLIGTNYWLIPLFGIEGAALATLISIFTVNTLRLIIIKIKMNILPFTPKMVIIPIIGTITYLIVYFIPSFDNFILDAVIRSIIIVVLFVPAIYYFKISDEFNALIDKSLRIIKLKK